MKRVGDYFPIEVYKVVFAEDDGRLVSATALNDACVTYTPNAWAKPPFGYFFSFKDWPSALRFVAGWEELQVWRAITGGTIGPIPQVLQIPSGKLVRQFWECEGQQRPLPEGTLLKQVEPGTVMSSSLKLLERIWP